MPARVLAIALDSAETRLLEKWSREGELPALARLAAGGARVRLHNPMNTLPDALWPELHTGIHGFRLGRYFPQSQIHTGEAHLRKCRPEEMYLEKQYWSVASQTGHHVAVFDQTLTPAAPGLNGVQLQGWGVSNTQFGYHSTPPEFAHAVEQRYGRHPVFRADLYPATRRGYERLLDDLLEGNRRRAALLTEQLKDQKWDLFTCSLSEAHDAGHSLWHFWDESHPAHESDAPAKLKQGLLSVYRALDQTVAALIDAAGERAHVLLLATHGMGPLTAGYQLLPEVLIRLGMGSDRGKLRHSRFRNLQSTLRDRVPLNWVAPLQALGRNPLLRRLQSAYGGMVFPLESPHTRAAFVPNNRVGAIRLNLKDREPFGSVQPGAEAKALLEELRHELAALVDPKTQQPIIERVFTPEEEFGPEFHADLPDLLMNFRTDLGRLDACYSPRVGLVESPARNARVPRSGDHGPASCAWSRGPGIEAGADLEPARMIDLAPTILDWLGVPLPKEMDGRPLFPAAVG